MFSSVYSPLQSFVVSAEGQTLFFCRVYNICMSTEQRVRIDLYQIIGDRATENYQLTWTILLGDTTIDGQRDFRCLRITSWNVPIVFIVFIRLDVWPSGRMYQLGSPGTDCRDIWYWRLAILFTWTQHNTRTQYGRLLLYTSFRSSIRPPSVKDIST
jgi:hypothetical protein